MLRACGVALVATVAISLTWQVTDAAPSSNQQQAQQARSAVQCARLANTRGWTRPSERGRRLFIRRCLQGKVG